MVQSEVRPGSLERIREPASGVGATLLRMQGRSATPMDQRLGVRIDLTTTTPCLLARQSEKRRPGGRGTPVRILTRKGQMR